MKTKLTSMLLSVTLIASLLAACGNASSPDEAPSSEPPPVTTDTPAVETPSPTPEPCEHDWLEANYQEPMTCAICGETDGEPLTPKFEQSGYTSQMVTAYEFNSYKTITNDSGNAPNQETIGLARFSASVTNNSTQHDTFYPREDAMSLEDFDIPEDAQVTEDTGHKFYDYPGGYVVEYNTGDFHHIVTLEKEGYEHLSISLDLIFHDDNAWKSGACFEPILVDYYSFDIDEVMVYDEPEDSSEQPSIDDSDSDIPGFELHKDTINFHGNAYDRYFSEGGWNGGWDSDYRKLYISNNLKFFVPIGYDGLMIILYNIANLDGVAIGEEYRLGDVIDEDTLFFRIGAPPTGYTPSTDTLQSGYNPPPDWEAAPAEDFWYEPVRELGGVCITRYTGTDDNVRIPDEIDGLPVVALGAGYRVFDDVAANEIKEVYLPNTVVHIYYAFSDLTGLTSLTIPERVTVIDNSTFYGCTSLFSLTLPDGLRRYTNGTGNLGMQVMYKGETYTIREYTISYDWGFDIVTDLPKEFYDAVYDW